MVVWFQVDFSCLPPQRSCPSAYQCPTARSRRMWWVVLFHGLFSNFLVQPAQSCFDKSLIKLEILTAKIFPQAAQKRKSVFLGLISLLEVFICGSSKLPSSKSDIFLWFWWSACFHLSESASEWRQRQSSKEVTVDIISVGYRFSVPNILGWGAGIRPVWHRLWRYGVWHNAVYIIIIMTFKYFIAFILIIFPQANTERVAEMLPSR